MGDDEAETIVSLAAARDRAQTLAKNAVHLACLSAATDEGVSRQAVSEIVQSLVDGPDDGSSSEACEMLEEITARARAMGLGLAKYTVADVEIVCAAFRALSRTRLRLITTTE